MKAETSSSSSNEYNRYYPITIIKKNNFDLQLSSLPPPSQSSQKSSSSSSIKLAIRKDERLEYLNIPKALIELLQINDFTIEMIVEYGPSKIAEILGIDSYVAQIIFNEINNKKS
jgi:hypothetical protein